MERFASRRAHLDGTQSWPDEVTINYIDCRPEPHSVERGVLLLIHGFPETSYQFRYVITHFVAAGYRVVVPDYRGAGHSSHPREGYAKSTMAKDLHTLLYNHLGLKSPVHVVGHDIGGMVAHSFASRFPTNTLSVTWGECPLPGTTAYDEFKHTQGVWHFTFHWQIDLPEALVHGRERIYLKHFYDRLCVNPTAIDETDLDHYESMFAQPGAMRAGFDLYRAFHLDADENRALLKRNGKCTVPAQALNGGESFLAGIAQSMISEMYETWSIATVDSSGHWCAEENPRDFVKKVLDFIQKYTGN